MPELPEVETTLRGVEPWIANQIITQLTVRQGSLRWPVTPGLAKIAPGPESLRPPQASQISDYAA